jgi:hypothetical protein
MRTMLLRLLDDGLIAKRLRDRNVAAEWRVKSES